MRTLRWRFDFAFLRVPFVSGACTERANVWLLWCCFWLAAYVSKVLGFALNPLKDEFFGAKPAPGTKGKPRDTKEASLHDASDQL
jgi:hypothetical protein